MSRWDRSIRPRLRVAEAAALLLLARILIVFVPMKYWRASLGKVSMAWVPSSAAADAAPAICVVRAVLRAAQRLPFEFVCLPRAMAVQWMLGRRGIPSALVLGIAPGAKAGRLHDLHAWVEAQGETIIGDDPDRRYHRGLVLVQ